jgi:SAM-dependent methyltransferase
VNERFEHADSEPWAWHPANKRFFTAHWWVELRGLSKCLLRNSVMTVVPDRATFESLYANKAPWDIGRPQQSFVDAAGRIEGSILDAGCGTGDTALFFAARGNPVTGIDFLEEPIRRAKLKAKEKGLGVTFLVKDALTLQNWNERFDNIIDSGLFHVFSDENRQRYVKGLANVLNPGGRLFLMCFSDEEPGSEGPRRVSKQELHDAFAQGWTIESIEPTHCETRADLKDFTFSPGGPKAWFAVIRRQ